MLRITIPLALAFLSAPLLTAQESPENKGGLGGFFNKLKDVVEEATPTSDDKDEAGKSWFDRARELSSSTLEKGKQGFDDLVTSGSEANTRMAELLAYLDKKLAGREPAFTSEEIQNMAIELIPLVEELNGRKFTTPPKVATTGNLEMIQILGNDLIPQYQKQFPEASKSAIFLRSYMSAGLFAPALMGKYGVTDKAVYVLPENVKATMEAQKIPSELAEDLMKIIVAHELTHALQDQEIDLNQTLFKVKGADASLAFQALVEGHAVYIQNATAKKLNLHKAAQAGRDILTAPEKGGEKFINHHAALGGIEKIWSMMKAPPSRTSMIVKPGTYTDKQLPPPSYDGLFDDAPQLLEAPGWKVSARAMGDFGIQSHLGAVPRGQREAIMKQLSKSVLLSFSNKSAEFGNGIDAVVFNFADDAGAVKMLSAMEQLNANDIKSAEASPMVKVLSQKKIAYDAGGGVRGSALRYQTKTPMLGEETTSVIQVRNKNVVAQIMYSDVDLKKRPVDNFLRSAIGKFQ